MTTDELRRMLELAARACALEVKCAGENYNGLTLWVRDSSDCPWFPWEPNTDDGDSARMRSALGISANWIWHAMNGEHKCVGVECSSPFSRALDVYLKDHNNDRDAALRLCALKVAAMIGEGDGVRHRIGTCSSCDNPEARYDYYTVGGGNKPE